MNCREVCVGVSLKAVLSPLKSAHLPGRHLPSLVACNANTGIGLQGATDLGPPSALCLGLLVCSCPFSRATPRLRAGQTCCTHTWGCTFPSLPTPTPALSPPPWEETVSLVTSSKGEAEHRGLPITMSGPSQNLWSSAQEPGPFLPQTSMPRSWGQNMWQRLPIPPDTRWTTPPASTASVLCPRYRWTCPKAHRA